MVLSKSQLLSQLLLGYWQLSCWHSLSVQLQDHNHLLIPTSVRIIYTTPNTYKLLVVSKIVIRLNKNEESRGIADTQSHFFVHLPYGSKGLSIRKYHLLDIASRKEALAGMLSF